jgi:hypothetical protein
VIGILVIGDGELRFLPAKGKCSSGSVGSVQKTGECAKNCVNHPSFAKATAGKQDTNHQYTTPPITTPPITIIPVYQSPIKPITTPQRCNGFFSLATIFLAN